VRAVTGVVDRTLPKAVPAIGLPKAEDLATQDVEEEMKALGGEDLLPSETDRARK